MDERHTCGGGFCVSSAADIAAALASAGLARAILKKVQRLFSFWELKVLPKCEHTLFKTHSLLARDHITLRAHGDDSHRACSFQRPGSDEGYRLAPTGCVSCSSFGVCVSPSSGRSDMEFGRNRAICGPQQRSLLVYVPTRSRVPHFRANWAHQRLSCQCAFVEPNPRSASTNFCGPLAPGTRLY